MNDLWDLIPWWDLWVSLSIKECPYESLKPFHYNKVYLQKIFGKYDYLLM